MKTTYRNKNGEVLSELNTYSWEFHKKYGGMYVRLNPHKFSIGLSLAYWPYIHAPAIIIYVGPLRLTAYWNIKRV